MMSFAVLSRTRQQCGSSSSPETPRSSWAVFESQSRGDMPAPAPPIRGEKKKKKSGDLSGPCVRPVGELWPCKYAANTFPLLVIESQSNCLEFAHDFKTSLFCFHLSHPRKHQGSADGRRSACIPLHVVTCLGIMRNLPRGFGGKQFSLTRATKTGLKTYKLNRIQYLYLQRRNVFASERASKTNNAHTHVNWDYLLMID